MKRFEIAMALGLLLTVLLSSVVTFAQGAEQVRQDVLRIHIIANSNSDRDQEIKFKVRDRILAECGDLFYQAESEEDARTIALQHIDEIRKAAEDEIQKTGYAFNVKAEVVNMFFNTREYEDFTMPAGKYDAVRITIGHGEGRNWWCVMFPPLCVPAAKANDYHELPDDEEAFVSQKPTFEPRFAILEFFERLKDKNWA